MAGDIQLTKCPVVKIEQATLDTYLDVSGLGDFQIVTFKRQLIWIRSATATVAMIRKGKVLRVVAEHNDYYGFLTAAEAALKEAKSIAALEEVGPGSEVQIVVTLDVVDEPAIFDLSWQALEYMKTFRSKIAYRSIIEPKDRRHFAYNGTEAMAEWVKGNQEDKFKLHAVVPWIDRNIVVSNQCLWDSSKHLDNPGADEAIAGDIEMLRAGTVDFTAKLVAQREDLLVTIRERQSRMSGA